MSAFAAFLTDFCLRRWDRTAETAGRMRMIWLPVYVLLTMLPVAGAFLPDGPVKNMAASAGNIWLGFFVHYGGLLCIGLFLFCILKAVSRGRLRSSDAGRCLVLVFFLAAGLLVYGMIHAQNTVVERYDLTVDKPGEDMKIVLLADLHLSVNSHLSLMEQMVGLVNAEEPDVVVVAGDIFTSMYEGLSDPDSYAEVIRGIQSKYGVYAVYGNHDVEETLFGGFPISPISEAFRTSEMEKFFDDCGFITLKDEVVTLPGGVILAGRLDGEKAGDGTTNRLSPEDLLSGADKTAPVVVLQHEPKEFEALSEAGADIALCGHTHNGQIFPGNLIIPYFNENAWGYKNLYGLDTIVTAGVGYYGPPMRVGTNSEVTVINLHCAG